MSTYALSGNRVSSNLHSADIRRVVALETACPFQNHSEAEAQDSRSRAPEPTESVAATLNGQALPIA